MEENNNIKIHLSTVFLIISLIIIIIMGFFIYKLYKDNQTADSKLADLNNEVARLENMVDNLKTTGGNQGKDVNNADIIKYELQTHEYFSDMPNVYKYYIDSENELNKFYSIYSDKLDINKEYLKNNSIFIQVEQVGSGSIQMKLSSVTFDNNTVNFIIAKDSPEIGTMDMAFWYFVAIIPNNQLKNLNLSNWNKPSEILSSTEDYKDELSKDNKKILIEKSYSNYAWSAQYNGMAIFNDGTIYSWNLTGNMKDLENYNVNSADGLKNYILENGKLENKKISAKDLEKIEEYINNIEDSIEIKYPGADQGTTTISAWNSNGKEIILSVKVDSVGENKTNNAQELLKIINRYL